MRIERATDAFLDWRRIEQDATPRSIESYRRILDKLAEDYPELDLPRFTKHDLRAFLKRWENRSSATRANVVSVLHSFFGWAVAEDLIEIDPSAAHTVYTATARGLFRSTDAGAHWAAFDAGLPVRTVEAIVVSGRTLYAGTRGAGVQTRQLV